MFWKSIKERFIRSYKRNDTSDKEGDTFADENDPSIPIDAKSYLARTDTRSLRPITTLMMGNMSGKVKPAIVRYVMEYGHSYEDAKQLIWEEHVKRIGRTECRELLIEQINKHPDSPRDFFDIEIFVWAHWELMDVGENIDRFVPVSKYRFALEARPKLKGIMQYLSEVYNYPLAVIVDTFKYLLRTDYSTYGTHYGLPYTHELFLIEKSVEIYKGDKWIVWDVRN